MKRILYVSAILSIGLAMLGQTASEHKDMNTTKGACSPIANNNQGSITIRCVGFSDAQNKQILELLHQLSLKQADDQDAILAKLNELLATVKATQRQGSPRIISEQKRSQILDSPWEQCARERIRITAPNGDSEAQALAAQLKSIFDRVYGMNAVLSYDTLPKVPGNTEDFKMVYDNWRDCSTTYLGSSLKDVFHIGYEAQLNTHSQSPPANQITTFIYVYRR